MLPNTGGPFPPSMIRPSVPDDLDLHEDVPSRAATGAADRDADIARTTGKAGPPAQPAYASGDGLDTQADVDSSPDVTPRPPEPYQPGAADALRLVDLDTDAEAPTR